MTQHHSSRHLRAVAGTRDDGPLTDDDFAHRQLEMFRPLIRYVGDPDALWALAATPLPDEPFDWSAVDEQDRAVVTQVLAATEECCAFLGDLELRTIARRLLALVAANDPRTLRRGSKVARLAAGLMWLAGQGAGGFARRGRRSAGWIWDWFGVGSCVDRGYSLFHAAGLTSTVDEVLDDRWIGSRDPVPLRDAGLLHSRFRESLVTRRDHLIALANERRTWTVDGVRERALQVSVRAQPAKPLNAVKGTLIGQNRGVIIIGFGDDAEEAEYRSLTIPDAHDLVHLLEQALAMPMPGLGAS